MVDAAGAGALHLAAAVPWMFPCDVPAALAVPEQGWGCSRGTPRSSKQEEVAWGGGAQADLPGKVLHGMCKSRVERGLNNYRRSPIFLNKAISSILQE